MWKNWLRSNRQDSDYRIDDFHELLRYVDKLAKNKMGYPVSLLTYLGVVDNKILGIKSGTLANVLLNNVGDPFKDSETSLLEVKRHERAILSILEKYYGAEKNSIRGYVTSGGTEGNFAGLWWSKRYLINKSLEKLIRFDGLLKQKLKEDQDFSVELNKISLNDYGNRLRSMEMILKVKFEIEKLKETVYQITTPTVFYTKSHTHYSVPKISEILHLNSKPIQSNDDGSMALNDFKRQLLFHMAAKPDSPVIIITNIGTTITGAIDDVREISTIIEESKPKPVYTIHMDGALTGFVLPILKPFGNIKNFFKDLH